MEGDLELLDAPTLTLTLTLALTFQLMLPPEEGEEELTDCGLGCDQSKSALKKGMKPESCEAVSGGAVVIGDEWCQKNANPNPNPNPHPNPNPNPNPHPHPNPNPNPHLGELGRGEAE